MSVSAGLKDTTEWILGVSEEANPQNALQGAIGHCELNLLLFLNSFNVFEGFFCLLFIFMMCQHSKLKCIVLQSYSLIPKEIPDSDCSVGCVYMSKQGNMAQIAFLMAAEFL